MTKKLFLAIFILGTFGIFSACTDKVDDIKDTIVGSFSCKLNNSAWAASVMAGSNVDGNLVITATKGKELITLTFDTAVVGKYPVNFTNIAVYTANVDSLSETTHLGVAGGEIELTSIDASNKRVSGSFHFEGYDMYMNKVTITAGVFKNVVYN